MDRSERARRAREYVAASLAAIAVVCFAPVATFGFAYDDRWTIEGNPALDRPLGFLLRAVFLGTEATRAIADSTRPVMLVSTWLDHRLFGKNPAGYHVSSLLLYALTAAVAGYALLALTRRVRVAIAGGAFFALAPVHAEAVASINYREDLIAGVAVIGVLGWIFSSRALPEKKSSAALFAALLLVGLLGKESAVALPLVVVGLLVIRRPGRDWFSSRRTTFIALGLVLAVWAAWRVSIRMQGVDDVPLSERAGVLATLLATARYEVQALVSSLAPFAWSPEYDPQGPASAAWALALAAIVVAAIWLARNRSTRPFAIGITLALLAALPTSPLVGPANERADRFVFVSVLGGGVVWGWLAHQLTVGRRKHAAWAAVALIPVLVPMAVVSRAAAAAWKSDLTLWNAASERAPGSYRTWVGLSRALRLTGDLDGAERAIERAIALYPDSRSAHVTRAYARLLRGDVVGARADIEKVKALGGTRQRGLRKAEQCAALEPRAARVCAGGKQ